MRTEIRSAEDLARVEKRLASFPKALLREAEAAMEATVDTFQAEVTERTPVGATEELRNAIFGEVLNLKGEEIVGRVGDTELHTLPVEEGTGPAVGRPRYMPPKGVLISWIEKKLGISDSEEQEEVEGAIRWKIYQKGTQGQHMFRDGWQAVEDRIQRLWDRLLKKAPEKHFK